MWISDAKGPTELSLGGQDWQGGDLVWVLQSMCFSQPLLRLTWDQHHLHWKVSDQDGSQALSVTKDGTRRSRPCHTITWPAVE